MRVLHLCDIKHKIGEVGNNPVYFMENTTERSAAHYYCEAPRDNYAGLLCIMPDYAVSGMASCFRYPNRLKSSGNRQMQERLQEVGPICSPIALLPPACPYQGGEGGGRVRTACNFLSCRLHGLSQAWQCTSSSAAQIHSNLHEQIVLGLNGPTRCSGHVPVPLS